MVGVVMTSMMVALGVQAVDRVIGRVMLLVCWVAGRKAIEDWSATSCFEVTTRPATCLLAVVVDRPFGVCS